MSKRYFSDLDSQEKTECMRRTMKQHLEYHEMQNRYRSFTAPLFLVAAFLFLIAIAVVGGG